MKFSVVGADKERQKKQKKHLRRCGRQHKPPRVGLGGDLNFILALMAAVWGADFGLSVVVAKARPINSVQLVEIDALYSPKCVVGD